MPAIPCRPRRARRRTQLDAVTMSVYDDLDYTHDKADRRVGMIPSSVDKDQAHLHQSMESRRLGLCDDEGAPVESKGGLKASTSSAAIRDEIAVKAHGRPTVTDVIERRTKLSHVPGKLRPPRQRIVKIYSKTSRDSARDSLASAEFHA